MGKRPRSSQATRSSPDSSSSSADSSSSSSEKQSKPEDLDVLVPAAEHEQQSGAPIAHHEESDANMSDLEQDDDPHPEWPDGPTQLSDLFDWSNRNADKLLEDVDGDRIRNFMKITDKVILHNDAYSGLGTASIACKCQLDGLLLKVNRHSGFRSGNNKQIPFGNLIVFGIAQLIVGKL